MFNTIGHPMNRLLSAMILCIAAASAQAAVTVNQSFDKYAQSTSLTTPQIKVADGTHGFFDPSFAKAWMSASVGKTGAIAYALNVYFYSGNGWAFFTSGRDSEGGDFKFVSVDRSTLGGDAISEQFLIVIDPTYLAAHRDGGLDIKFYGKGREMVVKMPPDQLQAILEASAATAAANSPTAAAPAIAAASAP